LAVFPLLVANKNIIHYDNTHNFTIILRHRRCFGADVTAVFVTWSLFI